MKEELLREFIIEEYGFGIYAVVATDVAYEMLSLTDKIISNKKYPHDTLPVEYYRAAILHWLVTNYTVDGVVRESKGNSHDSSWQKEIIILNKEGVWKDQFEKFKNQNADCYEKAPIIKEIETLTPELIDEWAKTYDLDGNGEDEEGRYVMLASANNTRYRFHFKHSHVVSTANATKYSWNRSESSRLYSPRPLSYRASGIYIESKKEHIKNK